MSEYNQWLSCIESFLFPKNGKKYLAGLALYATFIATIAQALMKEAIKDADGGSTFTIDATITNATVREISHAVLWNCRDFSMTKTFYRNLYIFGYSALAFYVLVYMTGPKCTCLCRLCNDDCECKPSYVLKCFSEGAYRIAFIFMLLSYDTDPLACLCGPSSITYNEYEQAVELTFDQNIQPFQLAAAIISVLAFLSALALNFVTAILDYKKCQNKNSKDLQAYEIKFDKKRSVELKKSKKVDKRETLKKLNQEHYIRVFIYT